ncbi:MAG TPA: error-prone DNA polymerase, partial [Streptomyces sp.]
DGMHGAVRLAQAARAHGLPVGHGAELSLDLPGEQTGVPEPAGTRLLAIARDLTGYRRLCGAISRAALAGGKNAPVYDLDATVEDLRGHVLVPTGGRRGHVRRALLERGPAAAADALRDLVAWFGAEHVVVELTDHQHPLDSEHNDVLAGLAAEQGLPVVATTNARYAAPEQAPHANLVDAIRAHRTLDDMQPWLGPGTEFLRSGAEMHDLFARYPGAVAASARLGREVAFDLRLLAPQLPPFPVPPEHGDEARYLRHLAYAGAAERYGPRARRPDAYAVIDRELAVIEELGFPGYFLTVWDIVRFARESGILAQGRGSAATSAVCYALRISNVDAVRHQLLFERFLNTERREPPDIDVDIEAQRREEVIQYVYRRHGRLNAALVANVITYRARSAVRDAARALGYSQAQQKDWAADVQRWPTVADAAAAARTAGDRHARGHEPPAAPPDVLDAAAWLDGTPRHLGIHPGGMVIASTPVSEIVPVETARMPGRTILQWDKDDAAAAGLVKFDLLGLGMLSALHHSLDLIAEHHGRRIDLGQLDPTDPAVFDLLCRADAVGLFQVESRAQLNTLPRLQPRTFFDLVVQVALIRPGPIQGGSVHPYIRRHRGEEPVTYDHPLTRKALQRTKGVPLFQEQVLQLAKDVANFSPGEADQLRRAMGSKRSRDRMQHLIRRFIAGTDRNGIPRDVSKKIFQRMEGFAGFGFPESHSFAFAHLVYSSAWLKLYYPSAYFASLLRSQPMGFYSPQTLVADARRRGVRTLPPDLNASLHHARLEPDPDSTGGVAIRLGLAGIRRIGDDVAHRIVAERDEAGPYTSIDNLTDRIQLDRHVVE